MAWTAEDKAKAMVVIECGLPLTRKLLEALNKTLAGVHSFEGTHNYCFKARQKLGLAGRAIPWLPADLAAVDAVGNSGLPLTKPLVERLISKMDGVHGWRAVYCRCDKARSVTTSKMLVERKRKSALCS
jgi:hypothetical protein